MRLVINIPKDRYNLLVRVANIPRGEEKLDEHAIAVLNGTPLPDKHGRLVDVCQVWSALYDMFDNLDMGMVHDALAKVPTILEATEVEE